MTRTATIYRLTLSFGALCLLSLAARADEPREGGNPAPAASSATEPSTRPALAVQEVAGPDGGLLHVVMPTTFPTTLPATLPTTAPSTQPASKPAVAVSPAAQSELDAIRDAYKPVASLHLAGTITGELDLNGQQASRHGSFEADFLASPDGASWRQSVHDDDDKSETIIGSTGEKLYALDPLMKQFQSTAVTNKKFAAGKMPRPYYDLLSQQNPSLLLALVEDAAAEILDGLVSCDKTDDVKIGDDECPNLRLVDSGGNTTDLSFDPKTHLIRRAVTDLRESYKKQGQLEVKKVLVTIDYSSTTPDVQFQKVKFAFTPPEGAREVTAMAEAGPEVGPGEASPANSLEGKAAPDFKLKGMDDNEVALADLKGNVIVLDFWATWCGPCRASLPHLNKLYEEKKGEGLKVYALDLKEDKDDVQQGIKELKLTVPVLLDSDGKVANKYLATGIPETVVIGKDGKIKKVIVGFGGSDAELRKAVEEAMK